MNKEIKSLLAQAHLEKHPDTNAVAERFAELIIAECCIALWTEECHTSDLAYETLKHNVSLIKERLGMK